MSDLRHALRRLASAPGFTAAAAAAFVRTDLRADQEETWKRCCRT